MDETTQEAVIDDKEREYLELLDRAYASVNREDLKVEKIKIPFPVCSRASKWTVFDNFNAICMAVQTKRGHLQKYYEQELCSNATIIKGGAMKIKGRFNFNQMQVLLKKYIKLYIVCEYCKTSKTQLNILPGKVMHKVCQQCKHTVTVTYLN